MPSRSSHLTPSVKLCSSMPLTSYTSSMLQLRRIFHQFRSVQDPHLNTTISSIWLWIRRAGASTLSIVIGFSRFGTLSKMHPSPRSASRFVATRVVRNPSFQFTKTHSMSLSLGSYAYRSLINKCLLWIRLVLTARLFSLIQFLTRSWKRFSLGTLTMKCLIKYAAQSKTSKRLT